MLWTFEVKHDKFNTVENLIGQNHVKIWISNYIVINS
jgi:hypothetical protein